MQMRKKRGPSLSTPVAKPVVLVIMGVSGCGKSTVAALLAGRLGWPFEEGDALHPQANVEKMAAGHPLTDDDRAPWLEKVAEWIDERLDAGENGHHHLLGSEALVSRRDQPARVRASCSSTWPAPRSTIAARLAARHGHFMPPSLLDSQFADLEEPDARMSRRSASTSARRPA